MMKIGEGVDPKLKDSAKEIIERLQKHVNELLNEPSMARYVRERKMHLIDSRFQILDNLVEKGILHA